MMFNLAENLRTNAISHLLSFKQKQPIGNTVDKIVSGYQVVYGGQVDEDVILHKCRDAISSMEKVEKEIGSDVHSGSTYIWFLLDNHSICKCFSLHNKS